MTAMPMTRAMCTPFWIIVADVLPATLARKRHHAMEISSIRKIYTQRHCLPGLFNTLSKQNSCDLPLSTSCRFNLVCGNQHKQRLLGTFTMTGLLIGSLIGGRSGDYFGRKKVLYAACLLISLALGIASVSISYPMFAACHLIYREEQNYGNQVVGNHLKSKQIETI